MKKVLFGLMFSLFVALGAATLFGGSPSGWQTPAAGPYIPISGGAELRGRSILGLGQTPLTTAALCAPATAGGTILKGAVVMLDGVTYTASSVVSVTGTNQNVTAVVGAAVLPATVASVASGAILQVSRPGSIVAVRVSYPVSVSVGNLLVSSGTAGELTVTTNTSLTATAGIVNFQALDTKVTSSTDQLVIARQLR